MTSIAAKLSKEKKTKNKRGRERATCKDDCASSSYNSHKSVTGPHQHELCSVHVFILPAAIHFEHFAFRKSTYRYI